MSKNKRLNIGEKSTNNKSVSVIKYFSELEQAIMLFRDWIFNVEELKFGNNLKPKEFTFALRKLCDFSISP